MTKTSRGKRKIRSGIVVSNKMAKTAVVSVSRSFRHPKYDKVVSSSKKYYAHDDQASTLKEGDRVTIVECRPISKLKHWRVVRKG